MDFNPNYYMEIPPLMEQMTFGEEPSECNWTSSQQYPQNCMDKCTIHQLSYQPNYGVKRTTLIRPKNNLKLCHNEPHKSTRRMECYTVYQLSYQRNRGEARTMPIYPKKYFRLNYKCGNSCCMTNDYFSMSTSLSRNCIRSCTTKPMIFQPTFWSQYAVPYCPPNNMMISYGTCRNFRF